MNSVFSKIFRMVVQHDCIQILPNTYKILKKEATFKKISNLEITGKGTMDVYL